MKSYAILCNQITQLNTMKSITGKPDQICKSLVKFFGEAKFELSSNEQTKVNQAKVWERNVGGQRNKSARTLS